MVMGSDGAGPAAAEHGAMLTKTDQAPGARRGPLLILAALTVQGAAVIHLAAAPMHFEEYLPFGIFFIAAALGQTALAIAIVATPSRRLLLGAILANLAVIWLYVVSRTIGIPIGPRPWRAESVGLPDAVCTGLEVLASLLLVVRALRPPPPRRRVTVALASAPAVLLISLLPSVGGDAAVEHRPYAVSAAPPTPDRPSTTVDLLTEASGSQPVRDFTLTAEPARIGGVVA